MGNEQPILAVRLFDNGRCYYPFVFFAVMMASQFLVILLFFPETKSLSLKELQEKLHLSEA
jgi:hypothetical protein